MNLTYRLRTDRELRARVIGIPLVALIPTVLAVTRGGETFWREYLISFTYTFVCWNGAVFLFDQARRQFPQLEKTGQRMALTLLGLVIYVLAVNLALSWFFCGLLGLNGHQGDYWEVFREATLTAFSLTFMCTAVYEVVYLVGQLMAAQRRADQLTQENMVAQLSRLKTQIQPHFLFNNFNTLAGVIEEDPKLASRMVQELASFYRYLLSATARDMVPLHEELDCLRAYAFLLKTRHEADFTLELNIDPAALDRLVPALSLQMLVENAVKHTALGPGHPLVVLVRADGESVLVENVLRPRKQPLPGAGVGLENLRMRLLLAGLPEPVIRKEGGRFRVEFALGVVGPPLPAPPPISGGGVPVSVEVSI